MRRSNLFCLAGVAGATLSFANPVAAQRPDTKPDFDVATVRISKEPPVRQAAPRGDMLPPPPAAPFSIRTTPVTLTILNATLMECLTWAHGVRAWQISAPDWFSADRYTIVGRPAGPVREDQLKLMLQRLLAERFRMVVRQEKKEARAMALVVEKSGPKFQAANADTEFRQDMSYVEGTGGVRYSFRNTPLERLAGLLSALDSGPVIDMTGLVGGFDFTFDRPHLDDREGESSVQGAIHGALQKQLGLKLERRKLPVDFLVIERASRIPTEN